MSNIEGLRLTLSFQQLQTHCIERVAHYTARSEASPEAGSLIVSPNQKSDERNAKRRAKRFAFIGAHLQADAVYQLNMAECFDLELLTDEDS